MTCLTIVELALGASVRPRSQSTPTPKTHELALVVVSVADGAPARPAALFVAIVAAPTIVLAAPVKPTTVMFAACDESRTAVAVIDNRGAETNVHQTSAPPCWTAELAARVQVCAAPLLVMPLTLVFAPAPTGGASVETNATSSVLAATANAGLVIVRSGPADRDTVVAIVGAVPSETTIATLLPPAASDPPVGVWLMTLPAATVVLAAVVTDTVKPAPVNDAVAAACVCPTTFGTDTGGGPLDTTRFTAVPTSTVSPLTGLWLITTPAGTVVLLCCVIVPTTSPFSRMMLIAVFAVFASPSGTPTTIGVIVPSEIVRSTGELAGSTVPSSGFTNITVPMWNSVLLAEPTVPTVSPAFRIAVVAAASVRPFTGGTVSSGFGVGIVMSENRSCSMLRRMSVPSER